MLTWTTQHLRRARWSKWNVSLKRRRALDKAFHSLVGCLIESRLSAKGTASAEIKQALEILSRYS